MIDENTKLYASFAAKAGSFGCKMHNFGFKWHGLNAIYKSFSASSIRPCLEAMRTLGIPGAGVTMPFKEAIIPHLDRLSPEAKQVQAVNTVVNSDGVLKGYNTDCMSAEERLRGYHHSEVVILGRGGYARAVAYAAKQLGKSTYTVTKDNWGELSTMQYRLIYNCTPVDGISPHRSNEFIDCLITTKSGMSLAVAQGAIQFKLYTGLDFPKQEFMASL